MNKFDIIYTQKSIQDLVQIGEYIALDNPIKAKSFIDELTNYIESLLSIFPYTSNTKYPKYPTVRLVPYKKYNIYYQVQDDKKEVEILHIFNSSKLPPFNK